MLKNLSKIILIFLFFGIFYIFIGNHLSVFADSCEGYGSCTRQVTQCTKGDSFCIGGEPGCVCKTSTYTQNVSCRILSAGTCGPNYSEAPGGYGCADFCAYVSSGGSGGGGGGGGSGGGDGGGSGGGGGGTAPTPLPACTTSTVETYKECGPFSGDPNQSCQVRKYVYNESWCASGNQYEVTSCETCARGCSGGTCNSCTDKQVIEIYNECGPFSGDPNQSCQVRKFRYTQPGCPTGDQFELVEGSCKTCTTGCGGGVCKAGSTPVPTSIPTAIPTTAPPPDVGCGAWYCHNGVSADGPRYVCGGTKYLQARQCRAADGSIYYEQRGEDMCSVNTCTVASAPTSAPPTATKAPTFPTATATLGPYPTYIPPTATKRPTWTSTPTPIGGGILSSDSCIQ